MRNCLKTRLKEAVQNDSLNYFGLVKVSFGIWESSLLTNRFISIKTKTPSVAKIEGGTFSETDPVTGSNTEISIPANTLHELHPSNTECVVYIPKYDITWIQIDGNNDYLTDDVKIDQLDLLEYADVTSGNICLQSDNTLDLAKLGNNNPIVFGFRGKIQGNLSAFSGMNNLQYLLLMGENTFNGNILSLSGLTKLKRFTCNSSNISGAIEDLAAAQVASPNNRTSGQLALAGNNGWTVDGNHVYSAIITFDSSLAEGYSITVG